MALGASRTRTVLTVILPTAFGGIVTATIVAVARAAGETAPLLFTCSIFVSTVVTTDPRQAMATLPIVIFTSSESPNAHDQQVAWAAALVLIAVVLIGSIVGRLLSARTTPADRACSMTEGLDDHTTAKAGEEMHTSDKSGIIDSMSDDVSESKSPEADVVGEPGLALARSQAKLAEMAGQHGASPQDGRRVVFGLDDVSVSYSGTLAIRDVDIRHPREPGDGVHRPLRLRKDHAASQHEPDERPDPGSRGRRQDHLPRAGSVRSRRGCGRGAPSHRDGVSATQSVPQVDLRQRRVRPADARDEGRPQRPRREGATPCGAMGRGQGPPQAQRAVALRRPAAAALYRAGAWRSSRT